MTIEEKVTLAKEQLVGIAPLLGLQSHTLRFITDEINKIGRSIRRAIVNGSAKAILNNLRTENRRQSEEDFTVAHAKVLVQTKITLQLKPDSLYFGQMELLKKYIEYFEKIAQEPGYDEVDDETDNEYHTSPIWLRALCLASALITIAEDSKSEEAFQQYQPSDSLGILKQSDQDTIGKLAQSFITSDLLSEDYVVSLNARILEAHQLCGVIWTRRLATNTRLDITIEELAQALKLLQKKLNTNLALKRQEVITARISRMDDILTVVKRMVPTSP